MRGVIRFEPRAKFGARADLKVRDILYGLRLLTLRAIVWNAEGLPSEALQYRRAGE